MPDHPFYARSAMNTKKKHIINSTIIVCLILFAGFFASPLLAQHHEPHAPAIAFDKSLDLKTYFTPEEIIDWKQYQTRKLWHHLIGIGSLVAFYILFLVTGLNKSIRILAEKGTAWCYNSRRFNQTGTRWPLLRTMAKMPEVLFGEKQGLTVIFYLFIFLFLLRLFFFPYSFYRSYYFELQQGLSNYSLGLWLLDYLKGLLLGTLFPTMMVFGIYGLITRIGNKWWIFIWAGVSVALLGYVQTLPYQRQIFNNFYSLEAGEIRSELEKLADQQDVSLDDIMIVDSGKRTKKVNAYFEGVGNSQRIVLYDTLLEQFTPREITMILAHEIVHWKEPHKFLSYLKVSVILFIVFYLGNRVLHWGSRIRRLHYSSPVDIAGLPVLLLTFFIIFQTIRPINSYYNRINELDADRQSLEMVCDPEAYIQVHVKLSRINHLDVSPHPLVIFLFYSHPPFLERITPALTTDCQI